MKFSHSFLVAIAAVLSAANASAQLKLPSATQSPAPTQPAAAAPASEPAAAGSPNAEKEAAAKLAAAGWLVLLDRRDWGRAWETASSVFRTSVPLSTWMEGIPKVREPMGALVQREPAESAYKTTLQGRPDGEYVTVIFLSKFDNRELQEVVTTVREADGKWRATGYSTR
jgi:Protein of unknown function (DUF4019)